MSFSWCRVVRAGRESVLFGGRFPCVRRNFRRGTKFFCTIPLHPQTVTSTSRHKPFSFPLVTLFRQYAKKKTQKIELTSDESAIINMEQIRKEMTSAMNTLKWEYDNVVTARITQASMGSVPIKVGQKQVLLRELAQFGSPDPNTIIVNLSAQPSCVQTVVKELQTRFHLNPTVEGSTLVKVPIPKPSKEMRENLCKDAKSFAEKAKVTLRKVRQQSIVNLRKQKSEVSKDSVRRIEDAIQKITDEFNESVGSLLKGKTDELRKP